VIDDSGSMIEDQAALAASAAAIIDPIVAAGFDWHLGAVTTDMNAGGASGRLRDAGEGTYLSGATPDPHVAFASLVSAGISGSSQERGRDAVYAALETHGATHNAGFERDDSQLAVIVLSDENDYSFTITRNGIETWLMGLRPDPARVTFSSIVSENPVCPTGGTPGDDYVAVTNAVGGVWWSVCAVPYDPALAQMLDLLVVDLTVELSAIPDPLTIVVEVMPVGGDASVLDSTAWTFDPVGNAVTLAAYPGPAGTAVAVTYTRADAP